MSESNPLVNVGESVRASGQKTRFTEADFPAIYANVVAMGVTPFDIFFMFGTVESASVEEVIARPVLKLILTPEIASVLKQLLETGLQQYIDNNGALRTVPTLEKK